MRRHLPSVSRKSTAKGIKIVIIDGYRYFEGKVTDCVWGVIFPICDHAAPWPSRAITTDNPAKMA